MKGAQVARDFIDHHRNSDPDAWQPFDKSGDAKLMEIYHRLAEGVYGEVRQVEGEYEIEIRASESATGRPILFTWQEQ